MNGYTLRCVGVVCLLIVGLIALLPRILSTEWGNRQILHFCNRQIAGRVEAKLIQLQWWGEQKIEGLTLRDPQGELVLKIDTLSLQGGLFAILRGHPTLGKGEIAQAHLLLHQNEAGLTNLEKALGMLPASRPVFSHTTPLLLSVPKAVFDFFSHPGLLQVFLEGTVDRAGETGKLDINLSIPDMVTTSWSSVAETGASQLLAKGNGTIVGSQIPVEILYYFSPVFSRISDEMVKETFGNTFHFSFSKSKEEHSPWAISFASPLLQVEAHVLESDGALRLQQPARLQGTLPPQIVSASTSGQWELGAPIDLSLEVAELSLPLASPKAWAAVAHLSWQERLASSHDLQRLTYLEGTCRITAPVDSDTVDFSLDSKGLWQQNPLSLRIQCTGKKRGNRWPFFQGSGSIEAVGIPLQWGMEESKDLAQLASSFQIKERELVLEADFHSPHIKLERVKFLTDPSIPDSRIQVKGAIDRIQVWSPGWQKWLTLEETLIDSTLTDLFSVQATLHTRFLGWQQEDASRSLSVLPLLFNCHVEGSIASLMEVNAEVIGEGIQAQFCGQLDLPHEKLLTKKGLCSLSLPPEALQNLSHLVLGDPFFHFATTSFELQVLPTQISLTPNWLSLLRMEGKLRLDQLALKAKNGMQIALSQVEVPWKIEGPQDQILCFLKAKWPHVNGTSSAGLGITLRVDHWLHGVETAFQDAKFELSTEWRSLALTTLSDWLGVPDLTPLLGHALDVDLNTSFDFSRIEPGYWDMHMDSALFHAKARLKLDESLTLYQSNKPTAEIRWTLTPEGYQYLARVRGWNALPNLAKSVVWDAYLTDLDIPLKGTELGDIHSKIVGQCETTDWTWDEVHTPSCRGQFLLGASSFLKDWKLSLSLFPTQTGSLPPLFSTSWTLSTEVPYTFDPAFAKLQGSCEMRQFPLSLCKKLLLFSPPLFEGLEAGLGEVVNAKMHCDLSHAQGPVEMHVESTYTALDLVGRVEEGGLILQEPLNISTVLSPQLLAWGSHQYGAYIDRVEPSSHRITLQIAPQDTRLPLWQGELSQISVGSGVFDLGKCFLRNQDGALTNFITPFEQGLISVWPTPLYFSIRENALHIKRFDCQLAGKYTLAGWGQAKLQPLRFNLTLGLHPDILQTVFHLTTKKNYLFQIPIKVHGGDVQINKTKVLARIGALATQLQNDTRGKLLGALLDAALSDSPSLSPPQPTTSPFPWEKPHNADY